MRIFFFSLYSFFFILSKICFSSDFAYITNQLSNTVSVIDLEKYEVFKEIPVGEKPAGVAVTSDGKKIFISNPESKEISVIDGIKLTNIKNIPLGRGPLGIALTKDNKFLLVADWYDDKVRVIDTNHLNLVQENNV